MLRAACDHEASVHAAAPGAGRRTLDWGGLLGLLDQKPQSHLVFEDLVLQGKEGAQECVQQEGQSQAARRYAAASLPPPTELRVGAPAAAPAGAAPPSAAPILNLDTEMPGSILWPTVLGDVGHEARPASPSSAFADAYVTSLLRL